MDTVTLTAHGWGAFWIMVFAIYGIVYLLQSIFKLIVFIIKK